MSATEQPPSRRAERYRPGLHFSPAANWMNDPNGLIRHDGVYHLFFQHNPHGPEWADMSWGHATSTDLLDWREQPVALHCTEHEMIFSGSAVSDEHDTSGLGAPGAPPLVAAYTSAYRGHPEHGGDQAQSIASSTDGGRTWTPYPGNPVHHRGRTDFRDPKVFRHPGPDGGGHWVMAAVDADASRLVVSTSPNLVDWHTASTFTSDRLPSFWECPDLFPLPLDGDPDDVRWVLALSTGGPAQHYLVGDFDGTAFTEDPAVPAGRFDWGADFYAAASFAGVPGRRLQLGWMGPVFRAPTSPWQGIMSLPRELALRTVDGAPRLCVAFAEELDARERAVAVLDRTAVAGTADLAVGASPRQRVRLRLEPGTADLAGITVHATGDGRGTSIGYDRATGEVVLDRTRSGEIPHERFHTPTRVPARLRDAVLELEVATDSMSVEVLVNGGEAAISELVFPPLGAHAVTAFADGGEAVVHGFTLADLEATAPHPPGV